MGYEPADDGPEAEIYRRLAREQADREAAARRLIWSLHPGDARKYLFSWKQIKKFGLRRR
jgi:hypothetical protein